MRVINRVMAGLVMGGALFLAPLLGSGTTMAQFSPSYELIQGLKKQDFYKVKTSVLKGGNVNARNDDGVPALSMAVDIGNASIVKFLVEQGAFVDMTDEKKVTPLMRAAGNGDKMSSAVLLYYKADPNAGDSLGETPLMKAARVGSLDVVKLLIEAGADVGIQDNTGHTALDYAEHSRKRSVEDALRKAENQ